MSIEQHDDRWRLTVRDGQKQLMWTFDTREQADLAEAQWNATVALNRQTAAALKSIEDLAGPLAEVKAAGEKLLGARRHAPADAQTDPSTPPTIPLGDVHRLILALFGMSANNSHVQSSLLRRGFKVKQIDNFTRAAGRTLAFQTALPPTIAGDPDWTDRLPHVRQAGWPVMCAERAER